MRSPRLQLLVPFLGLASLAAAATWEDRAAALFRVPVGEQVALSPDGHRVAFTTRAPGGLSITVVAVEQPGPRRVIPVPVPGPAPEAGALPPPLRFLRWATPKRLVFAPAERVVPLPPVTGPDGQPQPNPNGPTVHAPIMVADADGQDRGVLVDAAQFQETPVEAVQSLADLLRSPHELAAARGGAVHWKMPHLEVLGFHPRDREQLILGTHGAYSVPRQHLVDLRTGHVRDFGDEWPAPPADAGIYDWFRFKVVGERLPSARPATRWLDADLAQIQEELAARFPGRVVEVLDWSDHRARVLCRVTGGRDPGRVFVYQRTEDLVLEIFRCAPWLDSAEAHETRWLEVPAPAGPPLMAALTWPRTASARPPVVVLLPDGPAGRPLVAFAPAAQAFAELGCAVVQVHRRSDDATLAADAVAVVNHLTSDPTTPVDAARLVVLGLGDSGPAARATQAARPTAFKEAVVWPAAVTSPGESPAARAAAFRAVIAGLGTTAAESSLRPASVETGK